MWWHELNFLLAFEGSHPQPPAETPTLWASQAVLLQINSNFGWTPKNAGDVVRSISHLVTQKRSTSVIWKQCFQTCAAGLSLRHFNWWLRSMWAKLKKMTRCGWENCCLHKIKLQFVEPDDRNFKYEIRYEELPPEVFFFFFKSLQWHWCCFCQEPAASLAVASNVGVASSVEAAF